MTTATPTSSTTALALLFGPGDDAPGALAQAILPSDGGGDLGRALENFPQETRAAAAREVTAAAAGLLTVDPIGLLVAGWREYDDLTTAARRTLAAPASTELVHLATHRVTIEQQPYVTVEVDGRTVATVRLGLSVAFDVSALQAKVRAGRLAGVHAGSCDITLTLAIDGTDVATRQAHLELPGQIALKRPIRLLPARDYPPGDEDDPRV